MTNILKEKHEKESSLIFDFEKILPSPSMKEDTVQLIQWRYDHWGTKWIPYELDVFDMTLDETTKQLILEFVSANGPPEGILIECAKRYKDLEFHIDSYSPDAEYVISEDVTAETTSLTCVCNAEDPEEYENILHNTEIALDRKSVV